MSNYMKGYREGVRIASLDDAEEQYERKCSEIERDLVQLSAKVQRMHPSQCRREMREYIALSNFFHGFCSGYVKARGTSAGTGGRR